MNEGELEALAALAQDKPLQVRFIEMMPIGYGAAMPCVIKQKPGECIMPRDSSAASDVYKRQASEAGCDLKAPLRSGASDEELLTAIRTTIWEKPQEHHFELKQDIPATRGMYRIGG